MASAIFQNILAGDKGPKIGWNKEFQAKKCDKAIGGNKLKGG